MDSCTSKTSLKQLEFQFGTIEDKKYVYEYAVLVTSLTDEILTLAQHYRDKADCV